MRVLIDTTYLARAPLSGTGVYLERLVATLEELPGVEPIPVANPRRRPPAGGGLGSLRNLADDLRWTAVDLPRLAQRAAAAVIHHPVPMLSPASRTSAAQVITVHDLAFERLPELFDCRFVAYARLVHRWAARRAQAVVCVSATTAADVRERWGVAADRVVVAPLGPGQAALPPTVEVNADSPRPLRGESAFMPGRPRHFLYVGDAEPRKDLPTLLRTYAAYRRAAAEPLELVLAGGRGDELRRVAGGASGVRVAEAPDADALRTLHRQAAALVLPSRWEGFGLPVLEAMALGTPVLATRAGALPEVCGDGALLVPPGDAEALSRGLAQLAADPALRADLRRRGTTQAERFSWTACARAHQDAYSLALGPRQP